MLPLPPLPLSTSNSQLKSMVFSKYLLARNVNAQLCLWWCFGKNCPTLASMVFWRAPSDHWWWWPAVGAKYPPMEFCPKIFVPCFGKDLSLRISDGPEGIFAPLWLRWCFGGLRPTTGGGGRRWEPEPREPSSHRHSYLRLQLVQGGSEFLSLFACFCLYIVFLFSFFPRSFFLLPVTATPTYASN